MCTQTDLQAILHTVTDAAKERYGEQLQSVILYGSYARGDQDADSDIDVFVLVDTEDRPSPFCDVVASLLLQYGVLVSIVVKNRTQFEKYKDVLPYYQAVLKEGIVCG